MSKSFMTRDSVTGATAYIEDAAAALSLPVVLGSALWTSVKDPAYGAKGDGTTDDATAINNAIAAVNTAGGGIVFMPTGTYRVTQPISLPNGVWLRGAGARGTVIKAATTFSSTSVVRNSSQDGSQEYFYLSDLAVDANKGNGALASTAAVDLVSVFVNSFIRDVVIANASNVGLRLGAAAGGSGPVLVDNVWVLSSGGHGVFLEEVAGNGASIAGWTLRNVTSEHQASGKWAIYLKGLGHFNTGVDLRTIHIEQANTGAGTAGITIDGVSDVKLDGIELLAAASSPVKGIVITNNASNTRITVENLTNINLINPAIDDQLNGIQLTGSVPFYATPDVGIFRNTNQTPTYGATINVDATQGNYCLVVITNGTAFTVAQPTNYAVGQEITYEFVNLSGGASGAITWAANFKVDSAFVGPANNKRKTVTFRVRSGPQFIQVGAASPDMN